MPIPINLTKFIGCTPEEVKIQINENKLYLIENTLENLE